MPSTLCPCGSQKTYIQCCQPLHLGQAPLSAEQLMRSRYCAFVLGAIDYLKNTTVLGQQALLDLSAIEQWSKNSTWFGLQVLSHEQYAPDRSRVAFIAKWQDQQGEHSHHEQSEFVLRNGRWLFLDPTVTLALGRNDACICASGKKFKKCCAPYLP